MDQLQAVGVVGARPKSSPASLGLMRSVSPPTPTSSSVGPDEPYLEDKIGAAGVVTSEVPKAGAPSPPTSWKDVEQYSLEQMEDMLDRFKKY